MEKRNDLLPQILNVFKEYGIPDEPVKMLHVRNEKDQEKDVWNDFLIFVDVSSNVWVSIGTTDPGSNAYQRHPEGAAHMCLGLHKDIWVIDTHAVNNPKFAHRALCSRPMRGCKPIKYFRDVNKNRVYDSSDIIISGFVGINCHRASMVQSVQSIGDYSDGCQVRRDVTDHLFMMKSLIQFPCVQDSLRFNLYTYKFSCIIVDSTNFKM